VYKDSVQFVWVTSDESTLHIDFSHRINLYNLMKMLSAAGW